MEYNELIKIDFMWQTENYSSISQEKFIYSLGQSDLEWSTEARKWIELGESFLKSVNRHWNEIVWFAAVLKIKDKNNVFSYIT